MKTSRFSDSQIIAVLKQAEGGSPISAASAPTKTSGLLRHCVPCNDGGIGLPCRYTLTRINVRRL